MVFLLVISYVASALMLFYFAWLVWGQKKVSLIAGYRAGKYDDEKYAKVVGIALVLIGIIFLVTGVCFGLIEEEQMLTVNLVSTGSILGVALITMNIVKRTCRK